MCVALRRQHQRCSTSTCPQVIHHWVLRLKVECPAGCRVPHQCVSSMVHGQILTESPQLPLIPVEPWSAFVPKRSLSTTLTRAMIGPMLQPQRAHRNNWATKRWNSSHRWNTPAFFPSSHLHAGVCWLSFPPFMIFFHDWTKIKLPLLASQQPLEFIYFQYLNFCPWPPHFKEMQKKRMPQFFLCCCCCCRCWAQLGS